MIYLINPNQSLELILGGAVTTTELDYVVFTKHIILTGKEGKDNQHGTSNGGTAVTILAAPTLAGEQQWIESIAIHNADTVSATVSVRLNDNSTIRILMKHALSAGETLHYEANSGWYITAA